VGAKQVSETKFTSGPWKIVTTKQEGIIPNFHVQIGEDQISVFPYKRIYSEDRTQSGLVFDEEKIANINLIAAAPTLYEALLTAQDHIEMHKLEISHAKDAALIRAALARARGES
jgi:hypothetical protein